MQKTWCFHLSLNVASLSRAIGFYRVLFDMEPAKCHDDYAKFEVVEPPVVFSLVPHAVGAEGTRSRVGLTLASPDQLSQVRGRLEERGIHIHASHNPGAAFGVADPDGNAWQLSVGEDAPTWDTVSEPMPELAPAPGQPIVWEHYVTASLPSRIPHDDASVNEVRLTGTFNGPSPANERQRLIVDAFRVLKPGGKVVVHGLAGDKPFPRGMPTLPGMAAMVSQIPLHNDIPTALGEAGFGGIQFVKFTEKAWFEHDGVEIREVKAVGWKPLAPPVNATGEVIYRGPFQRIRDDEGNIYPRGQRVAIAPATWTMLRQSPQAAQFVFIEPEQAGKTCQVH
jgi:catechol 2,3-dioxygenase-like lactoylglutathione lyase family enzyme